MKIFYKGELPTILLDWNITKADCNQTEDFTRARLKVWLISHNNKILLDTSIGEDGNVKAVLPSELDEGIYSLRAIWVVNHGTNANPIFNRGQISISERKDVFGVTFYREEATTLSGNTVTMHVKSSVGVYGKDGMSAYELAVFRGETELDEALWVANLEEMNERFAEIQREWDSETSFRNTVAPTSQPYLFAGRCIRQPNWDDIDEFIKDKYTDGSCSGWLDAENGKLYRSFDFLYNDTVSFYVENTACGYRGIASAKPITREMAVTKADSEWWKYIPYCVNDGINDAGIHVSIYMLHREEGVLTNQNTEGRRRICTTALTSYLLANLHSIDDLRNMMDTLNVYAPNKDGSPFNSEYHFMVSDGESAYAIEFIDNETQIIDITDNPIINNFYLYGFNGQRSSLNPHGHGFERYSLINGGASLEDVAYTKVYSLVGTDSVWRTDYNDVFGNIDITNSTPDDDATLISVMNAAKAQYLNRYRGDGTWHTQHACEYDFTTRTLKVCTQENYDTWYPTAAGYAEWGSIGGNINSQADLMNALNDKVDKVNGKGLSTNDYTSADKNKLGALPSATELVAALDLKQNAEEGKGLSANDYTSAEKSKLNGIAEGAEVNVINTIKVNNTTLTPTGKAVNISVPTKTSDITNDSGYITNSALSGYATEDYVDDVVEGKQDTISDLATIRTNAQAGKTASDNLGGHTVSQNVPANAVFTDTVYDDTEVRGLISTETERATDAENEIAEDVAVIESKIPTQASSTNQLADKEFVNSSISTNTSNYISDDGEPFTSVSDLPTSGVTNNDYAFVTGTNTEGNTFFDRYKATVSGSNVSWAKEYRLNNSSFTAVQWTAITSGITAALVGKLNDLPTNSQLTTLLAGKADSDDIPTALAELTGDSTHRTVTDAEKSAWNGKSDFSGSYDDLEDKPTIPSIEGLATEEYVDEGLAGKADIGDSYTKDEEDALLSTKADEGNVYNKTEIDGFLNDKADAEDVYTKDEVDTELGKKQATLVSGTNIKTINGNSLLGSGNITIQGGGDAPVWGEIEGNIEDQADLAAALEEVADLKEQVEAYIGMGKETVVVTVTTSVQGVSVEGLVLNVYLNNSTTPDQYTTDEDGMVAFRVDSGYTYRIVFPDIQGCAGVGDVVHTASVAQRSIEVEYKAAASVYETLTFIAHKSTDSSAFSGVSMVVTYDGEGHTYTTGSDGKVTAQIPLGKSYSVALQRPTGYYFLSGSSFNYTAEQSQRIIYSMLASANSGVFIVCSNGDEITLDNWSTSGHVATDAIAIKIATTELYDNNGVFAISIDEMGVTQNTSYPKRKWSSLRALFTSIPTVTAASQTDKPYYYDGCTASQLIHMEGDTIGVDTPAVDWALAKSLTLSGIEHHGFLLSLGQMIILWQNSAEIDAILNTVRPTHAYTLRGLSNEKWASTQFSEMNSWNFTTAQNLSGKPYSYVVVVAYDFN